MGCLRVEINAVNDLGVLSDLVSVRLTSHLC